MTGLYLVEMLDVLRDAGCRVAENSTTDGWQERARSSGGFPATPLANFWHHTASSTKPEADLAWMIKSAPSAPIGNVLLDRTGTWWPIAAGASNCAGKGGPAQFSRGTIPADSGNTRGFQIEAANNGVGERWPAIQIDAYFAGSNALNDWFGNLPTDVISHAGYTSRKIDPATAAAVQGDWQPRLSNSSGTWNLADIRDECARRSSTTPDPGEDDDMYATATVWAGAQLHVFERGTDGALWHDWTDGSGAWWRESLGGQITASPSAAVHSDGKGIDVTARGTDGQIWHTWFAGEWRGWEPVGTWP